MPETKTVKSFVKGDARAVEAEIIKTRKGRVAKGDMIKVGKGKDAPRLTPSENKLLIAKVQGKNNTEAGLAAYNTDDPRVAESIARETLEKPRIKEALAVALQEAGINPQTMADVLRDAMAATKTASMQGEVFASDEPDHSVRVSAVKTAAELMRAAEEDGDGTGKPTFNFFGGQTFVKKAEVHNQ